MLRYIINIMKSKKVRTGYSNVFYFDESGQNYILDPQTANINIDGKSYIFYNYYEVTPFNIS